MACGVVFTAHFSETASNAIFAWYERIYHQSSFSKPRLDPINQARYIKWLRMLDAYRSTGKLFESGFGRGEFLLVALQEGWTCSGNEISPEACELVRRFGAQVHCGDISSIDNHDYHDVVVSLGTIEHTRDPHIQLRHYYRILRPGGAVFITTPNYNSVSRLLLGAGCRMFDVEHMFYFTPKTLCRLLRDAGFGVVKCWTQNLNIYEIVNGFRAQRRDTQHTYASYQTLRKSVESSVSLRFVKGLINFFINAFGIGEEMYVIALKPEKR